MLLFTLLDMERYFKFHNIDSLTKPFSEKFGGVVLPHNGLCKIDGTPAPQDYNDWVTLDYWAGCTCTERE